MEACRLVDDIINQEFLNVKEILVSSFLAN